MTPADTILQPTTVYGVTKVFNELLGTYYTNKYDLNFRSIRYPGIISSEMYAFNGTTDYSTCNNFLYCLKHFEFRNIFRSFRKESLYLLPQKRNFLTNDVYR